MKFSETQTYVTQENKRIVWRKGEVMGFYSVPFFILQIWSMGQKVIPLYGPTKALMERSLLASTRAAFSHPTKSYQTLLCPAFRREIPSKTTCVHCISHVPENLTQTLAFPFYFLRKTKRKVYEYLSPIWSLYRLNQFLETLIYFFPRDLPTILLSNRITYRWHVLHRS